MPSDIGFFNYIKEQLNSPEIAYRKMMGEYLLYYKGVLIGGIYDNRLLVKTAYEIKNCEKVLPYPNAKEMYLIENTEDREYLLQVIERVFSAIKK